MEMQLRRNEEALEKRDSTLISERLNPSKYGSGVELP